MWNKLWSVAIGQIQIHVQQLLLQVSGVMRTKKAHHRRRVQRMPVAAPVAAEATRTQTLHHQQTKPTLPPQPPSHNLPIDRRRQFTKSSGKAWPHRLIWSIKSGIWFVGSWWIKFYCFQPYWQGFGLYQNGWFQKSTNGIKRGKTKNGLLLPGTDPWFFCPICFALSRI